MQLQWLIIASLVSLAIASPSRISPLQPRTTPCTDAQVVEGLGVCLFSSPNLTVELTLFFNAVSSAQMRITHVSRMALVAMVRFVSVRKHYLRL